MKFPAKKSLGQHFLLNPSTIDKILRLAQVSSEDSILEIGPGPGRMTEQLVAKAGHVLAVEKDSSLVEALRNKFQGSEKCALVEADILEVSLEEILSPHKGPWKVVANLPYNIGTRILLKLLDHRHLFSSFYLMLQREVAERLVAQPGSKDYGSLSIVAQLFSKNRIVKILPPGAFTPPPRVDSAIVEFKIFADGFYVIHDLPIFEEVIQKAFSQRRKMMLNNLKGIRQLTLVRLKEIFFEAQIPLTSRAEEVSIEKFAALVHRMTVDG